MIKRIAAVILAAVCGLLSPTSSVAGPQVDIVIGPDAPKLERFAAEELKGQLERLFEAQVRIADVVSADASHVILLGSPETNGEIRARQGLWPKLSGQGHVLRSVAIDKRQALLLGGGSPVAALWAVYEFGQRFGIRYFMFGDLYPVTQPEFKLDGFDTVLEPKLPSRAWRALTDSPAGTGMWGLEEHRRVLGQLAKLKFNWVVIPKETWQPPVALRVDGDTAGRGVFRGAKQFENPEVATGQRDAERAAASDRLVQGVVGAAHALGMATTSQWPGIAQLRRPVWRQTQTSVLPHMESAELVKQLDRYGAVLPTAQVGDLDLWAYYFSRVAWGENLTIERACHDLVTPVCGEEVSPRVWKAFQYLEQATSLIAKHDPKFGVPAPDMITKHQINEPAPEWWTEAKDAYLNAMNEMYRANTRAREGGRVYTLYFARRSEFGLHYMSCLLSVRKAGIAQAKGDAETRLTELEAAVESIYAALNALAAVARSSSDRGTIAVLNEHAYRPLKRELEAASQ
jgi:hypothetical protein